MKQVLKSALVAAALPFAAFPLALGGASPAAAALIPPGPATVLSHGPAPWDMPNYLQGNLCEGPKQCREVLYWWIVSTPVYEIGVDENLFNLDFSINTTSGPKIVYAFSGGARIATAWLTERARESDVPADKLSFVLIGNGTRKYGGLSTWVLGDSIVAPPTQYDVIDIAREYDPIADFPTNPFNLLAMANALSAFNVIHMDYTDVDVDDPGNYAWTEGNTTYVFVPTANLPLLQPLRSMGLGALADQLEAPLRAIIDRAYDRDYLPAHPQGAQGAQTLRTLESDEPSSAVASLTVDSGDVSDEGGRGDRGDDYTDQDTDHDADGPADEPEVTSPPEEQPESDVTEAGPDAPTPQDGVEPALDEEPAPEPTDVDTDTAAGDDSTVTEKPTGPKHRAPLHGTKKANSVDAAASGGPAADSEATDAGSDDPDSSSDSDSPS